MSCTIFRLSGSYSPDAKRFHRTCSSPRSIPETIHTSPSKVTAAARPSREEVDVGDAHVAAPRIGQRQRDAIDDVVRAVGGDAAARDHRAVPVRRTTASRTPPSSRAASASHRRRARSAARPRHATTRKVEAGPAGMRSVTNRFESTCSRAPAGAPVTPTTVAVSRAVALIARRPSSHRPSSPRPHPPRRRRA